jgi:hypothetical protein
MQNFALAGFSAPQDPHTGLNAAPQDMQKRARSGFSAAQDGQLLALAIAQRYLRYAAAPPAR